MDSLARRMNEFIYGIIPITPENKPAYDSGEEERFGEFLHKHNVPFYHTEEVCVQKWGRLMVWKPDFILPTCDHLLLEYAGYTGTEYWEILNSKIRTYKKHRIPLLVVYKHDTNYNGWEKDMIMKLVHAGKSASKRPYLGWPLREPLPYAGPHCKLTGKVWGPSTRPLSWYNLEGLVDHEAYTRKVPRTSREL
jgi:hypothetical protein